MNQCDAQRQRLLQGSCESPKAEILEVATQRRNAHHRSEVSLIPMLLSLAWLLARRQRVEAFSRDAPLPRTQSVLQKIAGQALDGAALALAVSMALVLGAAVSCVWLCLPPRAAAGTIRRTMDPSTDPLGGRRAPTRTVREDDQNDTGY